MTVLAPAPPGNQLDERILDGALRCLGRWGVAKTTLDDVAREAGCSRATVYRTFPGGKESLLDALGRRELARFYERVARPLHAATSLEDLLVAGVAEAGRTLAGHAALQYLLAHEPEVILPRLAFRQMDEVLAMASRFLGPYLARWLPPGPDLDERAARAAEWVTRITLSYLCCPADGVDMGDEASIRRLVRAFVLPGLTLPVPNGLTSAQPHRA